MTKVPCYIKQGLGFGGISSCWKLPNANSSAAYMRCSRSHCQVNLEQYNQF